MDCNYILDKKIYVDLKTKESDENMERYYAIVASQDYLIKTDRINTKMFGGMLGGFAKDLSNFDENTWVGQNIVVDDKSTVKKSIILVQPANVYRNGAHLISILIKECDISDTKSSFVEVLGNRGIKNSKICKSNFYNTKLCYITNAVLDNVSVSYGTMGLLNSYLKDVEFHHTGDFKVSDSSLSNCTFSRNAKLHNCDITNCIFEENCEISNIKINSPKQSYVVIKSFDANKINKKPTSCVKKDKDSSFDFNYSLSEQYACITVDKENLYVWEFDNPEAYIYFRKRINFVNKLSNENVKTSNDNDGICL